MIGPYVSLSAGMAPGQQMVSDPVVSIGDRTRLEDALQSLRRHKG